MRKWIKDHGLPLLFGGLWATFTIILIVGDYQRSQIEAAEHGTSFSLSDWFTSLPALIAEGYHGEMLVATIYIITIPLLRARIAGKASPESRDSAPKVSE